MSTAMTYASTGVDYSAMDPFKRACQQAGRETTHHLEKQGYEEVTWSRGGPCYLYEAHDAYRGHVNEGLGTKNLVADAMYIETGHSYYDNVAVDTIAMIVNDMTTVGCEPVTVSMHLAAGSSNWFKDEQRYHDLIRGWKRGCDLAECTWAGGETPTLTDMIESETVIVSGSAAGDVRPKNRVIKPATEDGDAIVFLASSGIHANDLTMARRIAKQLPEKYLTSLPTGQTYGGALLQPTTIYVPVIEDCLTTRVGIHYAEHITGHGWRKLMRPVEPFVYVIDSPGEIPPLFQFMQEHGPISDYEAYGNFNMGAGFALYVPLSSVPTVIAIAARHNIAAWHAGHIEKRGDEKKVVIPSKGLEYTSEALAVR